ncbi:hypothetical protein [uncultured Dokdonia sp.]|uniref:hypothetical protein n=1 Tax=uncultured Dokdonia sp. TaxID=575653 RepID=UPI00260F4059|nr:hypothetical protein [uncultured Dokdonia sp.]
MKNKEYYKIDFNSEYILHFLQKENLTNDRYEEIKFRISRLNYYQFFKVFLKLIPTVYYQDGANVNGMSLNKQNIELFFEFEDYGDFPFPCVSNIKLRCSDILPEIKKGEKTKVIHNTKVIKELKLIKKSLALFQDYQNKESNEYFSALINDVIGVAKSNHIEYLKTKLIEDSYWGMPFLMYEDDSNDKGNFNIDCNIDYLKKLYRNLEREEFILQSNTCLDDFLFVFLYNWNEHESVIHLEMDHPQTYLFFKELGRQLNIKIPFSEIELSQKIHNNSGIIKATSLSSSAKRNSKIATLPKKGELIKELILDSIK